MRRLHTNWPTCIGGFSDILPAKKAFRKRVLFSGGFNSKSLHTGLEAAKPEINRNIRIGAPGSGYYFAIGGETYAGIDPDTLVELVRYVKDVGRYPLDMDRLGPADEEEQKVLSEPDEDTSPARVIPPSPIH